MDIKERLCPDGDVGRRVDFEDNHTEQWRWGDAQAGAVAGAHVLAEVQVVGKGQHAARRLDPAVFNDGRAVMQGVPS